MFIDKKRQFIEWCSVQRRSSAGPKPQGGAQNYEKHTSRGLGGGNEPPAGERGQSPEATNDISKKKGGAFRRHTTLYISNQKTTTLGPR